MTSLNKDKQLKKRRKIIKRVRKREFRKNGKKTQRERRGSKPSVANESPPSFFSLVSWGGGEWGEEEEGGGGGYFQGRNKRSWHMD